MMNIHPDFNKSGKRAESDASKKVDSLRFDQRVNGEKFDFEAARKAADVKSGNSTKTFNPTGRK